MNEISERVVVNFNINELLEHSQMYTEMENDLILKLLQKRLYGILREQTVKYKNKLACHDIVGKTSMYWLNIAGKEIFKS